MSNNTMNLAPQIADILKFSDLMGNVVGDDERINLYTNLVLEEMHGNNELRQSMMQDSPIGYRDGLADLFVVSVQLSRLCGYRISNDTLNYEKDELNHKHVYLVMFDKVNEILKHNFMIEKARLGVAANSLSGYCSVFADLFGINQAADLDAVMKSNFSKFCKSERSAKESALSWKHSGVNVEIRETGDSDYPYSLHSAEDTKKFPKGKLMKHVGFKEPVFSEVAL